MSGRLRERSGARPYVVAPKRLVRLMTHSTFPPCQSASASAASAKIWPLSPAASATCLSSATVSQQRSSSSASFFSMHSPNGSHEPLLSVEAGVDPVGGLLLVTGSTPVPHV